MFRISTLVWGWMTLLLAHSVARAQPTAPEQVQEAHQAERSDPPGYAETVGEALEEYGQGHFEEARRLLLKAHALFPNARTLRGLGLAEFELRNYPAAVEYLKQALASSVRPLDESLRAQTEQALARALDYTALVRIRVEPAHATVSIDGTAVELDPTTPTRLAVGKHLLEANADGYEKLSRSLELTGGEEQSLRLTLHKRSDTRATPVRRNPWLWTGLGVVVAGAVAGTLFALQARAPGTAAPDGGSTDAVLVGP
jgi:tetratricopeptide (TPR) repeat protein